jgi:hypothetical protein
MTTHRSMPVLLVLGLVPLVACRRTNDTTEPQPVVSNRQPTAAPPPVPRESARERAFRLIGEFRTKMCACIDRECARQISDEMVEWSKRDSEVLKTAVLTEEDKQAATRIGMEMANCMMKAMGTTPAPAGP